MPGIHPSSRQQVRWAFAAESRGQFPKGKAREWAHNWKCWTKVPMPPGCGPAMKVLDNVRRQHPTWKVPGPVLEAEALRKKVIPLPERARPAVRPAAKVATAGVVHVPIMRVKHRPAAIPFAAYVAKPKKGKKTKKAPAIRHWGFDDQGKRLSESKVRSSIKREHGRQKRLMTEDVASGSISRMMAFAEQVSREAAPKKKSRRAA